MQQNRSAISRRASGGKVGEAGFTIIEVLISITLFLIVSAAIYGLLEVTRADRKTSSLRVETMQTVRNALNSVGRDALNTGYKYRNLGSFFPDNIHNTVFGLTADTDTTPDRMMQLLSGNNVNDNSLNGTVKTDQITFIYGDESFNSGRTMTVNWVDCDGEQLVVSWASTTTPTPVPPVTNDLVIITGQNSSAIGMVTSVATGDPATGTVVSPCTYTAPTGTRRVIRFASSDPLLINKSGTSNIIRNVTAPATLSRVRLATYRVLNDGTLVRTEYGNVTNGKQDMPLAYNVQDMQIKYVLQDGTLSDDPAAGADGNLGTNDDTPTNMQNVRQVRITIKARSAESDKRNGNQPYTVTLTSTFNTRNLGYDAQ